MNRRQLLAGLAASGCSSALAAPDKGWSAAVEGGHPTARHGGKLVLRYNLALQQPPAGTGPLFARAGYFHPACAPNGAIVSDDFPADHRHQRGIFFAWTKTRLLLKGLPLQPDFWNLGSGTGRILAREAAWAAGRNGSLVLRATHEWEARSGEEWLPVLDETWESHLLPTGFKDPLHPAACYVLDLTSRQTPRYNLELPQYRYGGMALRGSREWLNAAAEYQVLTSSGADRRAADAAPAAWVDLSGRVGELTAGMTLMDHPGNLGTPNRLRVHPDVPYAAFCPSQAAPRNLEAGRTATFRYRILLHNGRPQLDLLQEQWRLFTNP